MTKIEFGMEFDGKYITFNPRITDRKLEIISNEYYEMAKDVPINILRAVMLIIKEDYEFFPKPKAFKGICLAKQYPDTYIPNRVSDEIVNSESNKKARKEFYDTVAIAHDSHVEDSNKLFRQCGFSHVMIGLGEEIIREPVKRQKAHEERERRRAETIEKAKKEADL